ncbi:ArsC family reductase [Dongshaea marina]|uniref:ArsC family reductase n=1 Tax=Dongshaea marina TaxID=2047966 RepID=UPI000D3E2F99|nr:ArsC family reductase [Dongshaea marina]
MPQLGTFLIQGNLTMTQSVTLYGIKSCDTVRKARKWLAEQEIQAQFHDFRTDGIDEQQLTLWCETLGWKKLLNTRSTTWRNLTESEKQLETQQQAVALMQQHPTLIKRPVLTRGEQILVGFKASDYAAELLEHAGS